MYSSFQFVYISSGILHVIRLIYVLKKSQIQKTTFCNLSRVFLACSFKTEIGSIKQQPACSTAHNNSFDSHDHQQHHVTTVIFVHYRRYLACNKCTYTKTKNQKKEKIKNLKNVKGAV